MIEQKKTSLLPIAAAFVLPILFIIAALYVQSQRTGTPPARDNTPISLVVHVVNKKGEPLEDKRVMIARDDVKGVPSSNPQTTKTDSAGMATAAITGADNYIIRVGHAVFRQKIAIPAGGKPVELKFTVDQ